MIMPHSIFLATKLQFFHMPLQTSCHIMCKFCSNQFIRICVIAKPNFYNILNWSAHINQNYWHHIQWYCSNLSINQSRHNILHVLGRSWIHYQPAKRLKQGPWAMVATPQWNSISIGNQSLTGKNFHPVKSWKRSNYWYILNQYFISWCLVLKSMEAVMLKAYQLWEKSY